MAGYITRVSKTIREELIMMYQKYIKRMLDFVLAAVGLMLLSPLLLVVIVWLYFSNKGAGVFFVQERPGLNERKFRLYKFKSMTDGRDAEGNLLPDAQRLTWGGRFIRKTSIDELPQLWNVLKGDMSFIGPRPLLVQYLPYYTEREKLRHSVRPGITGLAQVSGRNYLPWNERLELDAQYVEHSCFCQDFEIVCKTIFKVIRREDVVVALDPKVNVPLHVYRENHGDTKIS